MASSYCPSHQARMIPFGKHMLILSEAHIKCNILCTYLMKFAAIIYPSLGQLQGDLTELDKENLKTKMVEDQSKQQDQEREDECGICMETCTKMVLPFCGHSMCISCFHDWY